MIFYLNVCKSSEVLLDLTKKCYRHILQTCVCDLEKLWNLHPWSGHGPGMPALNGPTGAEEIDKRTFTGSFQPQSCCDSVTYQWSYVCGYVQILIYPYIFTRLFKEHLLKYSVSITQSHQDNILHFSKQYIVIKTKFCFDVYFPISVLVDCVSLNMFIMPVLG